MTRPWMALYLILLYLHIYFKIIIEFLEDEEPYFQGTENLICFMRLPLKATKISENSHLDFFFFFFFSFIFISWKLITLQYCSGFCHTLTWISHGFTCVPHPNPPLRLLPPSPAHPSGSSQCTSPEHLSHASSLGWWSVSPLIVYLFQCCSLWTAESKSLFCTSVSLFLFCI